MQSPNKENYANVCVVMEVVDVAGTLNMIWTASDFSCLTLNQAGHLVVMIILYTLTI